MEISECASIQGNCKILKMMDYMLARNSTSIVQVEMCAVHNFDPVENNRQPRYFGSTIPPSADTQSPVLTKCVLTVTWLRTLYTATH